MTTPPKPGETHTDDLDDDSEEDLDRCLDCGLLGCGGSCNDDYYG